jgi:hypothetical protein
MTPYTSFVAVEEKVVNEGGKSRRVEVPVEMPDGVSHDGVFGEAARPFAMLGGATRVKAMALTTQTPSFLPNAEDQAAMGLRQPAVFRPENTPGQAKLHPSLTGLKGTQKVDVKIWVSERSEANLAALKQLGFELVAGRAAQPKLCVGRIAADRLADLARLGFVTYVAPAR